MSDLAAALREGGHAELAAQLERREHAEAQSGAAHAFVDHTPRHPAVAVSLPASFTA
jgi:hypothetical protein